MAAPTGGKGEKGRGKKLLVGDQPASALPPSFADASKGAFGRVHSSLTPARGEKKGKEKGGKEGISRIIQKLQRARFVTVAQKEKGEGKDSLLISPCRFNGAEKKKKGGRRGGCSYGSSKKRKCGRQP